MAEKKIIKETPVLKIPTSHVIFISDIHFGWNTSSEEWQENIEKYFREWFIPFVKKTLETYPDAVVICLGDVYQDRKSIDIDVNNLVIDIFEDIASFIPVYILNGNHDLSKKTNKGNTSLRSLSNISNLTLIKEPTLLKFTQGNKILAKSIAIPYLGDCSEENKVLVNFSGTADYAFMHTDISGLKFDNGMEIKGAVDSEKFKGKIWSGHIHKRQETKRVIYVGSPYQLSRGEIGNEKGIYILDVSSGDFTFTPNTYSPLFQKVNVDELMNMFAPDRAKLLANNYTDIMIKEEDIKNYKQSDIYAIINESNAKRAELKVIRTESKNEVDIEDYRELSIEELISGLIDNMEDLSLEARAHMKEVSNKYFKAAQAELND